MGQKLILEELLLQKRRIDKSNELLAATELEEFSYDISISNLSKAFFRSVSSHYGAITRLRDDLICKGKKTEQQEAKWNNNCSKVNSFY